MFDSHSKKATFGRLPAMRYLVAVHFNFLHRDRLTRTRPSRGWGDGERWTRDLTETGQWFEGKW